MWDFDGISTRRLMERAGGGGSRSEDHVKTGDTLVHAGQSGVILNDENLLLLSREHESFLRGKKTDSVLRRQLLMSELGEAGLRLLGHPRIADVHPRVPANVSSPHPGVGRGHLAPGHDLPRRLNERAQYPYDLPVEFSVAFVVTAARHCSPLRTTNDLPWVSRAAWRFWRRSPHVGDFGLFVTLLSATGSGGVTSLKDIRTRSKLIIVGFAAGVAAFVASGSTGCSPVRTCSTCWFMPSRRVQRRSPLVSSFRAYYRSLKECSVSRRA